MDVTIPIYVNTIKPAGRDIRYRCQPLFADAPVVEHEQLQRAMLKLSGKLKQQFEGLAQLDRHDALSAALFQPELSSHVHKLQLDLRDRFLRTRMLLVQFKSFGRRVAMSPSLRQLWFELAPGEELKQRAEQVVTQFCRKLAKNGDHPEQYLKRVEVTHDAWIAPLELDIRVQTRRRKTDPSLASMWGAEEMEGAAELRRVGRCLDWLYPDELDLAQDRDREVEQLDRLLDTDDRRPVLVLGAPLVGKTNLIHAAVHRRIQRRKRPNATRRNVWLISPQRLISGMSFVGQWEERLLAILKEAKRRDHVLYFNDILGLYQAGISRDSKLAVADVLRAYIRRRDVRMLGEMTPQAFAALAERDRGLADEFQVVRLEETDEAATLGILISVQQRLEARHRCSFRLDVLPAVIEMFRRHQREAAFPGKAARLLSQLAVKFASRNVTRDFAFDEFHRSTGLSLDLLDQRRLLTRARIVEGLQQGVVGQKEAVDAMADVVSIAKARLNDPAKPLASFIFAGPTGVGKTQAAKSLAQFLFSDESRVLRLDMNEFASSYAAARLVGTADRPEGLLTAPVRQAPFCVVLLDEIEKAHEDVFDLLLQVLGEGRLTDALGRTTDFSNAMVIMTSNLGVREATQTVGFSNHQRQQAFLRAAQSFFRPELLNRIDRIIPFQQLSRAEIQKISQRLIEEVFDREGLTRRKCVLNIDPRAMEKIIDQGYHPQLGARALRRAIEDQLTRPIAARISGWMPDAPAVLHVLPERTGVRIGIQELSNVEATRWSRSTPSPRDLLEGTQQFMLRVQQTLEPRRPEGEISVSNLTSEQFRYFRLQEQLEVVRQQHRELQDQVEQLRDQTAPPRVAVQVPRYADRLLASAYGDGISSRRILLEITAAADIEAYLQDVVASAKPLERRIDQQAFQLRSQAAMLECMLQAEPTEDRIVLFIQAIARHDVLLNRLSNAYQQVLLGKLDLQVKTQKSGSATTRQFVVEGPFARRLLQPELGVHVGFDDRGRMFPFVVGEAVETVEGGAERSDLGSASSCGAPAADEVLPPVVRIASIEGKCLDLQSGMVAPTWPTAHKILEFLSANQRPPPELGSRS